MSGPIITIKRSQSNNAPASLANGELAYSFASNRLFIGQTDTAGSPTTVEYIGGKIIVDKVANLENIILRGGDINVGSAFVTGDVTLDRLFFTTYSNNGIMFAGANGIVDFVTGTNGKVLQIAEDGTPIFDDLNGGNY